MNRKNFKPLLCFYWISVTNVSVIFADFFSLRKSFYSPIANTARRDFTAWDFKIRSGMLEISVILIILLDKKI